MTKSKTAECQDDNTEYADLPLPAQLNVDADLLASEYEFKMNQCPTRVPLITGNTAQLHHRGRTKISSVYSASTRY